MSAKLQVEALLADLAQSTVLPEIALGLERVEACLARLGHPERRLPPVIHIAGTNGKGSTLATLKAMFEGAGKKVHAYTSPHLVQFHERIVLAGQEISDEALLDSLTRVRQAAAEIPLTFFEVTTLAAFVAFAEHPADLLLLEVGLGGRLDATNVVEHPLCCVITPIAEDHKEFLGDTLTAIAGEKAGIIKQGATVVVAEQVPEVMAALAQQVMDKGARGLLYGRDWHIDTAEGFSVVMGDRRQRLPEPVLPGAHQRMNAATAWVAAQAASSLGVTPEALLAGMAHVRWPARLQRLKHGSLVSLLKEGESLWLDGGHNPAAAEVIAAWARSQRDVGMVVGMLRRKDAAGFFEALRGADMALATIGMEEDGGYSAEELAGFSRGAATPYTSVEEALHGLHAQGCRCFIIGGSLYLAGKLLQNHS